jgi:pimeloyl-ACP methyl ester carboxylesterase
MRETDLPLPDGGVLHIYDGGDEGCADTAGESLPVLWHHGTPNTGTPPRPLFPEAARLGIRWVSYDRPGYGGSTSRPGRDVSSAAGYATLAADALGIERFAAMGHSGGGPHALACAALLPDRVTGAVVVSGLAPYGAPGLDWFAGMAASGVTALRTASQGRAEAERLHASGAPYDPEFAPADLEALVPGRGSTVWCATGPGRDPARTSTTTSPTPRLGASTRPRCAPPCCSSTAPRTGSHPSHTPGGSRTDCPRPCCASAPRTVISPR